MAEHLSAVCHEPPFVSSPPARRDSRRGTYCTVGWKISAESHIGFHVASLYFLTHPLRQSEAPERQKAKKWEEASGSPLLLCRFQLCAKPSMYLGLAALVGFHTVVCQRALIFTINILIYSFSLPFLIFFLSLSSCAAQTFPGTLQSYGCGGSTIAHHWYQDMVQQQWLPFCRQGCWWYSIPLRGEFLCKIHLQAENLMGCKVRSWRLFISAEAAHHFSFNYRRQDPIVKAIQLH